MNLTGFLQNRNNVDNGYLRQCLGSMALICDQIAIYDDASTQAVRPISEEFGATVLYGSKGAFNRELYHKADLLKIALRDQPEWLAWFDTDACLGLHWADRERAHRTLEQAGAQGVDLMFLHNLNLWRTPWWFRVDQKFNDLWHGVFWRNTGELHYQPRAGLHQQQFPFFYRDHDRPVNATRFEDPTGQLLHFGFASQEEIARKYFTYRAHGQKDWALNRLVDEEGMILEPAQSEWFPRIALDQIGFVSKNKPAPLFDPQTMAGFPSLEAWREASA